MTDSPCLLYETRTVRCAQRHKKMVDSMKSHTWTILIVFTLGMITFSGSMATAQLLHGKHQVVIDAAHGGSDTGVALTGKYHEKDITLMIATQLKRELDKTSNINAVLSRSADKDMSFSDRAKVVSASHAELFVGIHVNAGFGKEASGYEIYFPMVMSESGRHVDSQEIIKDMAKNKYMNDSVKLAQLIQRNIETVFPRKSRGLRNAPFAVFESLASPAVIVEIGFSTNHEDKKKIIDDNIRAAIARAISKSITEYF